MLISGADAPLQRLLRLSQEIRAHCRLEVGFCHFGFEVRPEWTIACGIERLSTQYILTGIEDQLVNKPRWLYALQFLPPHLDNQLPHQRLDAFEPRYVGAGIGL